MARNSPSESSADVLPPRIAGRCLGADPPAPVSNSPPPASRGTWKAFWRWCQVQGWEEIGQVVPQNTSVAEMVSVRPCTLAGHLGGLNGQDTDIQPFGLQWSALPSHI